MFNQKSTQTILVTGHCGLIGRALCRALEAQGHRVRGLDIRGDGEANGDLCDAAALNAAMQDCDGIVHLGAVSRVIDGERDPERCWAVNAEGTRQLAELAGEQVRKPWVVYASSREVYGEAASLPANEDTPRVPVNIYGESKIAAEDAVLASGLQSAIVRFSNVFGSTADHADRVVPAFCRQAANGEPLRVDGFDHTFDFTYLDDVVRGVMLLIEKMREGLDRPIVHFVSGVPTTLGELARLAVEVAGSASEIQEGPSRSFDVAKFFGDPSRAKDLLGWTPQVTLREGVQRLVEEFRREAALLPAE